MKKVIFTILAVLVFCVLFSQEIPQKISYQGKLLENGIPVTSTVDIEFAIGSWFEKHYGVEVNDGLYSVVLGEMTPIPIDLFNNIINLTLQVIC